MEINPYPRRRVLLLGAAALIAGPVAVAGGLRLVAGGKGRPQAQDPPPSAASAPAPIEPGQASANSTGPPTVSAGPAGYLYRRAGGPNRTEVIDPAGNRIAVLTDGARTANLRGPSRTFREPRFTDATVTTDAYVRMLPQPWQAGAENESWFGDWLSAARADPKPDLLAVAMEYTYGADAKTDERGTQYAGDAAFGPLSDIDPDGRAENSDFYDYLGVSWTFPDGPDQKPSRTHFRSLDCSGFLRMVYGYRMGYPLLGTNARGPGIPRQAFAIAANGPGVQLMPNTGGRARGSDLLLAGDMLFFNAGPTQGANIEHCAIYLGVDSNGEHRFVSSRSQANGPTMGDLAGVSSLDGSGYWAARWRTARRI